MSTTTSATSVEELRQMTPKEFRDIIGHFASGVTVITALHDGKPFGTTASAVSSLSLEPPMLLICLNKTSSSEKAISASQRFAVNILGEDQADEAMRFATKSAEEKFEGVAVVDGEWGEPLLGGALAILECQVAEQVTGGTHTVFLAEVKRATARAGTPLAYFRGQFGRIQLEEDEEAFRVIRARVLSREIPIGEPLSLDDIAALVGTPRGPVYHAMARLTGEGLMSRTSDGSFVVTPLNVEAVEAAQRARYAIELGVASLTIGNASPDRLSELREALATTEPARYGNEDGSFQLDPYVASYMAFRDKVVALADTSALVDAYQLQNAPQMIISMTGAQMSATGGDRESAQTAYEHHTALLDAYEAGDLEAVNRLNKEHMEWTLDVTRRFMDAAGGEI